MDSTTRIDELPDGNITMRIPGEDNNNPTYTPMNIHPNPYGNSLQPNVMPLPQSNPDTKPRPVYLPQENREIAHNTPQVRLPSRDIPRDESIYQQDEEIQPNYIPRPEFSKDYVKEHEEITEYNIKKHERDKENTSLVDKVLSQLQTPILVALLFFIFQMPMVNTMFYRNTSFLSVYNSDGNINFYGIALKSVVFGSIFYSLHTSIDYLTDI
jgi:hypothetical protein